MSSGTNIGIEKRIVSQDDGQRIWNQEQAIFDVTEMICGLMQEQSISRAELAKLLGKSRPYVTQLLDGTANITIRTLSDVLGVLQSRFRPQAEPLKPEAQISDSRRYQLENDIQWQNEDSVWKNEPHFTAITNRA